MSMCAQIAIQIGPEEWAHAYVHFDGYPSQKSWDKSVRGQGNSGRQTIFATEPIQERKCPFTQHLRRQ